MLPQLCICALRLLLLLLLPLLAVRLSCRAQNVNFSFSRFPPGADILLDGNCFLAGQALILTTGYPGDYPPGQPVCRAVYPLPVQFYDEETGSQASFSVYFRFSADLRRKSYRTLRADNAGDGMAFIIAPSRTVPPGSSGSGLGLYRNSATDIAGDSSFNLLAVEFDSSYNAGEDPVDDANHIGLDINSVSSVKTANLSQYGLDLKYNPRLFNVWIDYYAHSQELLVYMADDSRDWTPPPKSDATLVLHYTGLDVASIVEPHSFVGFTATTSGDDVLNTWVSSWNFSTSGLDLPQPPSRSAAPPGQGFSYRSPPPEPQTGSNSSKSKSKSKSSGKTGLLVGGGVAIGAACLLLALIGWGLCWCRSGGFSGKNDQGGLRAGTVDFRG